MFWVYIGTINHLQILSICLSVPLLKEKSPNQKLKLYTREVDQITI